MVPLLKEVKGRSLAFGQRQRYLLDKGGKTGAGGGHQQNSENGLFEGWGSFLPPF